MTKKSWLQTEEREDLVFLVTLIGGSTLCSIKTNGGLFQTLEKVWKVDRPKKEKEKEKC